MGLRSFQTQLPLSKRACVEEAERHEHVPVRGYSEMLLVTERTVDRVTATTTEVIITHQWEHSFESEAAWVHS